MEVLQMRSQSYSTGSLSRAISSGGIRRFKDSIIFSDSHSKTIIVMFKFSSALESSSNGGNKNIFVKCDGLKSLMSTQSITHLVDTC